MRGEEDGVRWGRHFGGAGRGSGVAAGSRVPWTLTLVFPQVPAALSAPRRHGEYDPCLGPFRGCGARGEGRGACARVSGAPRGAGGLDHSQKSVSLQLILFALCCSLAKLRKSRTFCSQPDERTPNVSEALDERGERVARARSRPCTGSGRAAA